MALQGRTVSGCGSRFRGSRPSDHHAVWDYAHQPRGDGARPVHCVGDSVRTDFGASLHLLGGTKFLDSCPTLTCGRYRPGHYRAAGAGWAGSQLIQSCLSPQLVSIQSATALLVHVSRRVKYRTTYRNIGLRINTKSSGRHQKNRADVSPALSGQNHDASKPAAAMEPHCTAGRALRLNAHLRLRLLSAAASTHSGARDQAGVHPVTTGGALARQLLLPYPDKLHW